MEIQTQKYTIVLPIKKQTSGNGYEFFRQIGHKTYNTFLDTTNLDKFIIICPSSDIDEIKEFLKSPIKPSIVDVVDFLPEENLLNPTLSCQGWFKQQLIKLCVCKHVKTEHYLTLDSDMYLNQRFTYDNLFENKKIKLNYEPWHFQNSSDYSTNSRWWRESCAVLGLDVDMLKNEKHLMGVTPQIFVTEYVKKLVSFLENKYGGGWQKILCKLQFTEYTLYWLYLTSNRLNNIYTHEGYPLWFHDHSTNTLNPCDVNTAIKAVVRSFDKPVSYFSVIQSYLNITPLQPIVNTIDKYLSARKEKNLVLERVKIDSIPYSIPPSDRKKYDAVFLIASMLTPNRPQSYTPEERFAQTVETVKSARMKVPNSYCVLIEGSILSDKHRIAFSSLFDHVLLLGEEPSIQSFVNDPRNIGHGEIKLLQIGLRYVLENKICSGTPVATERSGTPVATVGSGTRYLFKLGARYKLNDNFVLSNYDPEKYNFREHFDESVNAKVFTTGLYSIPVKKLLEFKTVQEKAQEILSKEEKMIERVYKILIPNEQINLVDTLGLEGNLSYNKRFFQV